jgi:cytochrome c5
MTMKNILFVALTLCSFAALADESKIHLKDAPGKDLVAAKCSICHSTDMIQINSPFLDRKGWEALVAKMVNVMGAPITPEEAPVVVDYLTKNYGK